MKFYSNRKLYNLSEKKLIIKCLKFPMVECDENIGVIKFCLAPYYRNLRIFRNH